MASGDNSAKKGTQLSFIEESYSIKEPEIQLRSRYDQFSSYKYVDKTKLSYNIPRPPSQHHSFFRNLPLYSCETRPNWH